MLSIPHMIVVFIVVLVVFGPQKLPELARSLGKLMAEFRKASTDFKSAFEEEMREMEKRLLLRPWPARLVCPSLLQVLLTRMRRQGSLRSNPTSRKTP